MIIVEIEDSAGAEFWKQIYDRKESPEAKNTGQGMIADFADGEKAT